MAISNLVSLNDLKAKNAATARLAPSFATPTVSAPVAKTPVASAPSVKGVMPPPQIAPPSTPPAYDRMSGLLTDYGRSVGLPEVNGGKKAAPSTPAVTTPPVQSGYSSTNPPTYSGLVSATANQAGALNTQAGKINTTAEKIGSQTQMSPAELAANVEAAKLESARANATANIGTHGWSAAFQQGQEGLINRNVNAQVSAAEEVAQRYAAQRGVATSALTGQANAENQAGGLIGAGAGVLSNAASLSKPSDQFPFVFDPLTAGFKAPGVNGGGAGGLTYNPIQDAQTFAQQVISHQIPYADAVRALGYAGTTAEGLLQQAITKAGGNLTQLQAQTGIQQGQEQQVQAYRSALQQGQNLQSQLTDLISTFGLNPNDLRAANVAIQSIANQTSDPRYALLNNYINDIANTYSQILTPPGGTATDTTRNIASSMLDGAKSGKSLIDIMQGLDQAANAKISGIQTITPSASSSGGGSVGWY